MKTAIYQRPTRSTQQHTVAIRLGEGDHREININEAQHLYECIDVTINAGLLPALTLIGARADDVEEFFNDLGMAIQDYLDFVNGEGES